MKMGNKEIKMNFDGKERECLRCGLKGFKYVKNESQQIIPLCDYHLSDTIADLLEGKTNFKTNIDFSEMGYDTETFTFAEKSHPITGWLFKN